MKKGNFNNRLGFTLIELLAVIVILAIIAAIAVPIVLNVISDSKVSANITSSENYIEAVELSIVKSNAYTEDFYPEECLINNNGNLLCDNSDIEVFVELDGEKPTSGKVTFKDGHVNTATLIFSDMAIIRNEDGEMIHNEEIAQKAIRVGNVEYILQDFDVAIENSTIDNPAVLLGDVTLNKSYILSADKDMSLDLNGNTITSNDVDAIVLKGNNSTLTISNGTIKATGNSSAISIGRSRQNVSSVVKRHLIINEDVSIIGENYGIAAYGKGSVDLYGEITVTNNGYGLSGNGSINNEDTIFNIYPGSKITANNGVALYLPQRGVTNISGGEFIGYTAVGIKSGQLNITGGTFTAVGDLIEPVAKKDGINPTGDVVLIEEYSTYKGNIVVNITGGTFTSEKNGYIIQENNTTGRPTTVTGIYSVKNVVSGTTNRFYYTK